jgi:hypothetical protein
LYLVIASPNSARADTLRLPLASYYHPGRAIPVEWNLTNAGGAIRISADGAMTTQLPSAGASHGVFPFLIFGAPPAEIDWQTPTGSGKNLGDTLQAVEDSDRLVGYTDDDDSTAQLFPGHRIIPVEIDFGELAKSPAMAWQSLDAIVLTPANLAALTDAQSNAIYANGVMLAVATDTKPPGNLPWKRIGPFWTASAGLPTPPIINADAYAPFSEIDPGRSSGSRRQILLLGVIFCIIAGAVLLLRSRLMPIALVAAAGIFSASLWLYQSRQSPIVQAGGSIEIPAVLLSDQWTFISARQSANFELNINESVHPIFYDPAQIGWSNLALICDGQGEPKEIDGSIKPDWPLAILRRYFDSHPDSNGASTNGASASGASSNGASSGDATSNNKIDSPLRQLVVQSIYPGQSILKQMQSANLSPTDDQAQCPTILIGPRLFH